MTKRMQPRGSANFPLGVTIGAPATVSSTNAITANPGGGQTNAVAVTSRINRVTTVATAADSVKLSQAKAGTQITIINSGANSLQVFGQSGETINGVASATGVALAAGKVGDYVCPLDGLWFLNLSA